MIAIWLMALCHAADRHVTVVWGPDGPEIPQAMHLHTAIADGRAQVVDDAGTTLAEVPLVDPRQRTLILPDGGGLVATLDHAVSRVKVPWPEGAHAVRLGATLWRPPAAPLPPPPGPGALVPLLESGDPVERLDLVFMGDGYPDDKLDKYADDVSAVVEYLLTLAPYKGYTGLFNIWRIDLVSADEGVTHSENDPPVERDTALGCFYGCTGLDRLVCCDDDAVAETVEALIPDADGVVVLVNDPIYGGSGGFNYATSFVGDEGPQVAAHELGHTLVGLWDEYDYGVASNTSELGPNCSPDPEGHWHQWTDKAAVGAFEVCTYSDYYRPTADDCMMRTLQDGYCVVCREQVVLEMYGRVPSLVRSVSPVPGTEIIARSKDASAPIVVETLGPDDGLVHEWSLDGEVVIDDEPDLDVRCSGLTGELTLRVYDPTPWVRSDPAGLLDETIGPWTVRSDDCDASESPLASCNCSTSAPAAGWLAVVGSLMWARRRR